MTSYSPGEVLLTETVDKKDVVRVMGQIVESDFSKVESTIAPVLGFQTG